MQASLWPSLSGTGGGAATQGALSLGVLAAYFSYVQALFQPMREIADKWNIFLSGMASAERIFSILAWPAELPGISTKDEEKKPIKQLQIQGHIVFEKVWFAYENEHWVLRDFSIEILPGMKVGVVGHTGAGKTTLMSLLMRFYDPQHGRILLDGKDIREYDKQELRASIGLIQQDVFLFSGSVQENISFWGENQPQDFIAQSLDSSKEFLFQGGELELQERGNNLSSGQRQMLAFARALAARPLVWILDEATANMDSDSEMKLQNALFSASSGKTLLIIAHRLATIRSADLILVLHRGILVENGTHDQLLRREGLYARLHRFQSVASQTAQDLPKQ